MKPSGNTILRLLQFLITVYAFFAVFHTTWLYLLRPLSRLPWLSTVSVSTTAHHVGHLSQSTVQRAPAVNLDLDLAVLLDDDHWADVSTSRYASSDLVQLPRSRAFGRKIGHVSGYLIIGTMVRIPAESAGIRRMMADDGINTSVTKLLMTSYYLSTCPA